MSKSGSMGGDNTACYPAAWAFFKKRELMGVKMPKKAKVAPTRASATSRVALPSAAAAATVTTTGPPTAVEMSYITLPGEDDDSVPIYDTCDDIRRKITAHLSKPGVTAAQFCRDISAMFRLEPSKKIHSKVLSDFRNKKGAQAGNTSSIFYGAYVYFEKKRIMEGKPKSKKREKMEVEYTAEGGMDTKRRHDRYWAPRGASVTEDQIGRVRIY
jgi:hypothetical protein